MIGITDIKRTLDGTQQPATFSEVSSPDDNSGTVAVSRPPLLEACKDQMKQRPRLGCAGIIRRGEAVLLGRRDKEPNRGLWVLPGGGVKFGESFANTLARELLEEAGIDVDVEE